MSKIKRLMSMLLCAAILLSGMSVSVLAEELDPPACAHEQISTRQVTGEAATCTTDGYHIVITECADCQTELSRETVMDEALGHDYTCFSEPATCMEAGKVTFTCLRCGDTYTETGEAALGHDYQETDRIEATYETEGSVTYTCSRCEDSYTESLPKLPKPAVPFKQTATVGGVKITVTATAGVFDVDASLNISGASNGDFTNAVETILRNANGDDIVIIHAVYNISGADMHGHAQSKLENIDLSSIMAAYPNGTVSVSVRRYNAGAANTEDKAVRVSADVSNGGSTVSFGLSELGLYDVVIVVHPAADTEQETDESDAEDNVNTEDAEITETGENVGEAGTANNNANPETDENIEGDESSENAETGEDSQAAGEPGDTDADENTEGDLNAEGDENTSSDAATENDEDLAEGVNAESIGFAEGDENTDETENADTEDNTEDNEGAEENEGTLKDEINEDADPNEDGNTNEVESTGSNGAADADENPAGDENNGEVLENIDDENSDDDGNVEGIAEDSYNAEDEEDTEGDGDNKDADNDENPDMDENPEENGNPENGVDSGEEVYDETGEDDELIETGECVEDDDDALEGDAPEMETVEETLDIVQIYDPSGSNKDNDELLTSYVERLLGLGGGQKRLRSAYSVGAGLTGGDAYFYGILKDMVTEIAGGSRSSTAYELNAEFGPWTADDLGVDAIVTYNNEGELVFTSEAVNAAYAIIDEQIPRANIIPVMNALRVDCPYELYWYNKTVTSAYHYSRGASGDYDNTSEQYVITCSVHVDYAMPVAAAYQDNGDEFSVDASMVRYAQTAIANIQNILDGASGLTVMGKLSYFKTAICNLVTYNHAAADDDSTPYGDPWQLVWVFDGNPNSNVVCEGYSKAFKYLCDQVGIQCLLVTGKMGEGNHMWNLVRLDGYSYFVDVTNSDEGSVGAGGELFMATIDPNNDWDSYTIICGNNNAVHYQYDDVTKATYSQEVLTVKRTGQGSNPEQYTITFAPGDGVGEMPAVALNGESIYQLPACGFTAPAGMQFKEWSVAIGTAAAVIKAPGDEIMVDANTTVTAIWDLPAPVFEGHAILLTGQIGLQFFLKLPDGKTAADYPESYVTFAGNKVNSSAAHAMPSSTEEINGIDSGKYLFEVNLSSIQMADKITPTFHYTEGGIEKTVTGAPYSVKDYISWALGAGAGSLTPKQSAIIPKLADYGHYAQIYLSRQNNWTIGTSYAEMTTCLTNSYNYSSVMSATQGSEISKTESSAQVTSVNHRLSFGSTTTLTVRILPADANGSLNITASGARVSKSDEYYMVTYSGIYANQLADTRTITAGDCTITVSPMSYVYEMLRNDTVQNDAKDLMCAFYYYAQACN